MGDLKNHIAPFVIFNAFSVALLRSTLKWGIAWRRDRFIAVRNRLRWAPLGTFQGIADWARGGDPTDSRPVHKLTHPVVIVAWLVGCVGFAALLSYGGYNYLRYGHSL